MSIRAAIVLVFGLAGWVQAWAQGTGIQIDLSPANPTAADGISYKLSGTWPNGCTPQSPQTTFSGSTVQIQTSNPAPVCTQVVTPWALAGPVGKLAAGAYELVVTYTGASSSAIEVGRKPFLVTGSTAANEVIFPVVVNGAISDKLFYQTIFTVVNTSGQPIAALLQVYDNAGKTGGVFCSPLAPPPSSIGASLGPNAQLFQFTSADLPFHNGWASLRWDGAGTVLASEEVSLIAATPARCMLVCNRPSTEKLSSTQIYAVSPAREFRLPMTINGFRQTALALINPSSTDTATVKVSILDASGAAASLGLPGTFHLRIGPLQRVSEFLWQMVVEHFPSFANTPPPDSFQGTVVLSSDLPIAAGSLNIMFPEGKFVAVPLVSLIP
jgi:hypothetical protein